MDENSYLCAKYLAMDEKLARLRKYNLWDSNSFDWGYIRRDYTDKITDFVGNRLIKVLVGQRRSGKSYILRQVVRQLIAQGVKPENTLLINREFTDIDFLQTCKDLDELIKSYKKALNPSGKIYIFIDEVQLIEGWEKFINSYSQDYAESYELFICGSTSKLLSGELATLLSGRFVGFEVFPYIHRQHREVLQGAGAREKLRRRCRLHRVH
jgi:predicted AAA+ superfamily ATPase